MFAALVCVHVRHGSSLCGCPALPRSAPLLSCCSPAPLCSSALLLPSAPFSIQVTWVKDGPGDASQRDAATAAHAPGGSSPAAVTVTAAAAIGGGPGAVAERVAREVLPRDSVTQLLLGAYFFLVSSLKSFSSLQFAPKALQFAPKALFLRTSMQTPRSLIAWFFLFCSL